jgi:hypothetical protein
VLSDKTYARLGDDLAKKSSPIPDALRQDILAFYSDPNAAVATKKNKKDW